MVTNSSNTKNTTHKPAPNSVDELLERASLLAGLTLGELAQIENIRVPDDFKREKAGADNYWN